MRNAYLHMSYFESLGFVIIGNRDGLKMLATEVLSVANCDPSLSDMRPRNRAPYYEQQSENGKWVSKVSRFVDSFKEVSVINLDCNKEVANMIGRGEVDFRLLQTLSAKKLDQIDSMRLPAANDLEKGLGKPRDEDLYFFVEGKKGFVVGSGKGLYFLVEKLISMCDFWKVGDVSHEHLSMVPEEISRNSLEAFIQNIDLLELERRHDYLDL